MEPFYSVVVIVMLDIIDIREDVILSGSVQIISIPSPIVTLLLQVFHIFSKPAAIVPRTIE